MSDNASYSPEAAAFADRISELLACMRADEAKLGALLVEIEHRGVMELFGYRSTARLLEHLGDLPRTTAYRLIRRARALNPGRDPDGTPIPALAPATGAAARSGSLSNPMIDVITKVLADVPPEHRDSTETNLLTSAEEAGYKQVAALGDRILTDLTPDNDTSNETKPPAPARELVLRRRRSGTWELNGRFDDETGTRASALLDALAEHRTDDDSPDHRTHPQRYGDAFSDAIDLALNSPDLPMPVGGRVHVQVAVAPEDPKPRATPGNTDETSTAEARAHTRDSMIIPAVLGATSEPPTLGRLRRLIPAGLRRTLSPPRPGLRLPQVSSPAPPQSSALRRRHQPEQPGADVRPPGSTGAETQAQQPPEPLPYAA